MNTLKTAILAALLIVFPISGFAAAKTVAIVPFRVNAQKDMNFLRDGVYDMLSSRLYKAGEIEVLSRQTVEQAMPPAGTTFTETTARDLGRKLAADYVLFGSLTVLGDSISIDSKMVDVTGGKPTMSFIDQSTDVGGIVTKINSMAADINAGMFGRAAAARAAAPAAAAGAAAKEEPAGPADIHANPETAFKQQAGFGGEGQDSPFVSEETSREFSPRFWKSAGFKLLFNGIALGDVDGDGKTEAVIITPDKVLVYRMEQQRFIQVYDLGEKSGNYHIGVDIADINGNGIPEIFVTSMTVTRKALSSFVLEFDGKAFRTVAENLSWYFRVNDLPARGKILVGQEHRSGSPYSGKIYEMLWRNNQYEPETPLRTDGKINALGIALGDVMDDKREAIVAYDENSHIRIFDDTGKEMWQSAERYGGSTLYYAGDMTAPGEIERAIYFPMRLMVQPAAKDGKTRLLAVRNQDVAGLKLERFRKFTEAQIISFFWDGLGLAPAWKTRLITGYIRDFAYGDFNNDGTTEIVCAVVLDEGALITTTPKSTVVALQMK